MRVAIIIIRGFRYCSANIGLRSPWGSALDDSFLCDSFPGVSFLVARSLVASGEVCVRVLIIE